MLRTFWRPNREVRATHLREVRAGPYLPVQLCHGTRRIKCRPKHETVWLNSSLSGLVYLFQGTVDVKQLWNGSQWNGLCWKKIFFYFSEFSSSEVQNKFSEFIFLSSENWHVVTGWWPQSIETDVFIQPSPWWGGGHFAPPPCGFSKITRKRKGAA